MRRLFFVAALLGCDSTNPQYRIDFASLVGGVPFSCGVSYYGIGTSNSTIAPIDFRMYVHGMKLVRAGGEKVPLELVQDGVWQLDDLALLDFEDGTGTCVTGSPETNFTIVGSAPAHDDYTGVEFTVGVPADHDHLDVATAKAPLNQSAMWWSRQGGYRYLKLEVQSTGNPSWFFHLGAEACSQTFDCTYPDLALISLSGFKLGQSKVALDLQTLYADSDLDAQVDGVIDVVPGCQSSSGDPECAPLFNKLGLAFEDMGSAPAQTFFVTK